MSAIKEKLLQLGIRPSRGLGQHFLIDKRIAVRQVEAAEITEEDTVLEIGPGLGILTSEIVERAGKTIVIEKDTVLSNYLSQEFSERLEIIRGDVLDIELPSFDKVISNIPFNISSPLTFKLLEENFECGVLMYQKEYARRMTAKSGEKNYSRLSVMTSIKSNITKLFDVSRNSFYPPPRVDATVVKIEPSEPGFELGHPDLFARVVRELFNYRRKKIKNALEYGFNIKLSPDIPYGDKRVEKLSPKEISSLVDHMVDKGLF